MATTKRAPVKAKVPARERRCNGRKDVEALCWQVLGHEDDPDRESWLSSCQIGAGHPTHGSQEVRALLTDLRAWLKRAAPIAAEAERSAARLGELRLLVATSPEQSVARVVRRIGTLPSPTPAALAARVRLAAWLGGGGWEARKVAAVSLLYGNWPSSLGAGASARKVLTAETGNIARILRRQPKGSPSLALLAMALPHPTPGKRT